MTDQTDENDPGFHEWIDDCVELATAAGFRGLLQAYFAGHDLEECRDLAVGATEILEQIHQGLEEDQAQGECISCRLKALIYPEPEQPSGNN